MGEAQKSSPPGNPQNSSINTRRPHSEQFRKKAEMLKKSFFPPPPDADTEDIQGFIYAEPKACPLIITKAEVVDAIRRPKADKAAGPDGVPNRILQVFPEKLAEALTPLYQACVDIGYHPVAFKEANIMAFKKPGKEDYTVPKAYKPIALLNTLGKTLESIVAKKIMYLAEQHRLLPDTHMGARRGKSTESALELLTEQIHTVWGQGTDKIATLLSIDVSGAFDTVSHPMLLHNLRKRKIPQWIATWVGSFYKTEPPR